MIRKNGERTHDARTHGATVQEIEDGNAAIGSDSSPAGTDADLTEEIFATVRRFRHAVRHGARTGFPRQAVTQSQTELLRLIGRCPGISVGEAARILSLAPNTLSTMATDLVRAGLLTRVAPSEDRRVRRLALSPTAQAQADLSRGTRHAVVAAALERLGDGDLETLARGVDALALLTDLIGSNGRDPDDGKDSDEGRNGMDDGTHDGHEC